MYNQNETAQGVIPANVPPQIIQLIAQAQADINRGDRTTAYQRALEATRQAPNSTETWLLRSRLAMSEEEILFCISQIHRIDPYHPLARQASYKMVWKLLERDPYLAYQEETDELYMVRSNAYMSLAVPKDRAIPEVFPPKKPGPLAPSYRWLSLALFGLFFSGVGALLFAPLAILSALSALSGPLGRADRIRIGVIVMASFVILIVAVLLGWLLYLHLKG